MHGNLKKPVVTYNQCNVGQNTNAPPAMPFSNASTFWASRVSIIKSKL